VQEASGELALSRRVLPRVDRREIAAIFAGGALGTLARAALAEALARLGPAKAASEVAKALGLDRRTLYQRALAMKGVR